MDYSSIVNEALKVVLWLVPIVLITNLFRSAWFKGYVGEQIVRLSATFLLPREQYHPIHNVTLQTLDGTTQIDHIFVSRYGIFVVETKNMSGWIFGGEKQTQWTQKINRNSYKFQNPLRQNFKHVKALEAALNFPAEAIHSIVVFVGGSTFKTKMPVNVTHGGGYVSYIKSFQSPVLSEAQVQEAVVQIESGRLEPSRATHREHIQRLKSRSDPNARRQCPNCGSAMILRTAKRGARAGNKFWGCSRFPNCKVVQNVPKQII